METVTSKDGTTLGFDRLGEGPPVVLVCGGSVDRMADAAIAQELSSDFTVLNYDRRGRGASGDTPPYAIEREVDGGCVLDVHGVGYEVFVPLRILGRLPQPPETVTLDAASPNSRWRTAAA